MLSNGVVAWAMSPSKYVQEAVKGVEEHLEKRYEGRRLYKHAATPFPKDY